MTARADRDDRESDGAAFRRKAVRRGVASDEGWVSVRHDLVAVIHTPAGAQTYEPEPPDEDEALPEQRVAPTARLQLRYLGFGSGEHLFGIDALAERAVEHLTYRVNGANSQQLLGYPQHVQDDPRRPGQIVLFHIDGGGNSGFDFMDAGDVHFLGTPEDIGAGRWDQITVYPNTC